MNTAQIFQVALGLTPPWYIERVEFTKGAEGASQLDIYLNFPIGSKFSDADGHPCSIHDTLDRSWRHLNFFQHHCYLHARVPRIITPSGKIIQVQVPWARAGSGFTLLFEAFAMILIENEMPVNKAAAIVDVYPNRLWTIFHYWIQRALARADHSQVKKIGIDETSSRKGHNYVTVAADLEQKKVIFVCPDNDENTVQKLKNHLDTKNVKPEQIERFALDMSPAYIAGINNNFPTSSITFDRFHVVKKLNEALDDVRKSERREHEMLKGHKYTFLKNSHNLSKDERRAKYELLELLPTLGEACRLVELFHDFWSFKDRQNAEAFLAFWCDSVDESEVHPLKKFVKTVKGHWSGIVNFIESKISNGILEGINSKIQLAKSRARGYKNIDNFISMIYFIAGKLDFDYPYKTT